MIESKSIWEATSVPRRTFKTFSGKASADVVVIGGGITGLTTAVRLSDEGLKVMVLEAQSIGLGTTGNSTGNLYAMLDTPLSELQKKWDAATVSSVTASRTAAIGDIESLIARFGISCSFRRVPFHYFDEAGKGESFLEKESHALREHGYVNEILQKATAPFPVSRLMVVPDQAQFHPLDYVRGLSEGASARCEIFENSRVIDYDEKEGVVKTQSGEIHARYIVLATHVPIGILPWYQTLMYAYREHGVAAELQEGFCAEGIFWSAGSPKRSVRGMSYNGKEYVIVVGDMYKTGQGGDTRAYIAELEQFLSQRFAVKGSFTYWGGQQYRPADGLPFIGQDSERLFVAAGFGTDGLVYGTLAAQIIADGITGKSNRWAALYKPRRFTPAKSFTEFVKENADVFAQYLKDFPMRGLTLSEDDVKKGEGRVISAHGKKLAVYRDDSGATHVCSAICTHLKCVVNFNPSEKSWDCPCHGSRFRINGSVIEGPAMYPLAQLHDDGSSVK